MTNTAQHTPAPWEIEGQHPWTITCPVAGLEDHPDRPRGSVATVGYLPNARLIAAAPELLEAAMDALEVWDDLYSHTCDPDPDGDADEIACFEALRAAIEKATGQ